MAKHPLQPGMFGHEFRSVKARFGISCGQYRTGNSVVHNGGWYNKLGEKIGWGDLSAKDLEHIAADLDPGEVFIVLGERDSFWNFVTGFGVVGSLCARKPEEQVPGLDYMIEKARLFVVPGKIAWIEMWSDNEEIKRRELREILAQEAPAAG